MITFIKRDYLDHHDIGFAFLPAYSGKGFAFEGASAVLATLKDDPAHPVILATTLVSNVKSIGLLEKLGFRFDKEIEVEEEQLLVYARRSI